MLSARGKSIVKQVYWLSYRVNKDDGNRQTDGQNDRQTDAGDANNPSAEEAKGKKNWKHLFDYHGWVPTTTQILLKWPSPKLV